MHEFLGYVLVVVRVFAVVVGLGWLLGTLVYGFRKEPRMTLLILSGIAIFGILVWYHVPDLAIVALVALVAFIIWLIKTEPRR